MESEIPLSRTVENFRVSVIGVVDWHNRCGYDLEWNEENYTSNILFGGISGTVISISTTKKGRFLHVGDVFITEEPMSEVRYNWADYGKYNIWLMHKTFVVSARSIQKDSISPARSAVVWWLRRRLESLDIVLDR